jgi:small subunit ribosomal protein S6
LRYYEFTYIVNPEIETDDLQQLTARVGQIIADAGGEVLRLESWGRRRLAYPIRKFREGHYVVTYIQLDPEAIAGLKSRLALVEEVIRYLLVKTEEIPSQAAPTVPREEPQRTYPAGEDEDEDEERQAAWDQNNENADEELGG